MNCTKESMLLYAITDRAWVGKQTLMEQVKDSLEGGITFLQLREKDLDEARFLEEANEMKALASKYRVPFVINDNVDIALPAEQMGYMWGRVIWQPLKPEKNWVRIKLSACLHRLWSKLWLRKRWELIIWEWGPYLPPLQRMRM